MAGQGAMDGMVARRRHSEPGRWDHINGVASRMDFHWLINRFRTKSAALNTPQGRPARPPEGRRRGLFPLRRKLIH